MTSPNYFRIALGGFSSAAFALCVACTDQLVSLGDTGDAGALDAQAPDASFVCPSGFAHPNLCCSPDGSGGSSCRTPFPHPFEPCSGGRPVVLDTASCCPPDSQGGSGLSAMDCFVCSPSGSCKPRDGGGGEPPQQVCDPGNPFTCNDDPNAPSPHGQCVNGGTECQCSPQSPKNPHTGRCE